MSAKLNSHIASTQNIATPWMVLVLPFLPGLVEKPKGTNFKHRFGFVCSSVACRIEGGAEEYLMSQ